jgi:twinkle protein
MSDLLTSVSYRDLTKRGINEQTCRHWSYGVSEYHGRQVQVAQFYTSSGELVAQKLRYPDKSFVVLGDIKRAGLYGEHLWRDGGRMVVVTEGEIDALSVSQLQGNKWPVVSIPNGAQSAKKAVASSLEWLDKFETVVFMFDSDEAGQKAAVECAQLLPPGKAKIAKLPLKDANEMLVANRGPEVIDAMWGAKVYRPDGIIGGEELWDALQREDSGRSVPYPYEGLNQKLLGLRTGELVTLCAGSGIGKSAICREIAHHLMRMGETVGYIALEESVKRTMQGFIGIELNRPIHLGVQASQPEMREAFDRIKDRICCYDHFGSTDSDNLMAKIRYMVKALGCSFVVLDHLSIVVSGQEDGDERRNIDNLMTQLRTLVEQVGCGLILVSHLKRPDGVGHEEGAQTSLSQLRGSAAIGQLSDAVIGLERDQQDPELRNVTKVRVLKSRFTGDTGLATFLLYDKKTGRLSETEDPALKGGDSSDEEKDF